MSIKLKQNILKKHLDTPREFAYLLNELIIPYSLTKKILRDTSSDFLLQIVDHFLKLSCDTSIKTWDDQILYIIAEILIKRNKKYVIGITKVFIENKEPHSILNQFFRQYPKLYLKNMDIVKQLFCDDIILVNIFEDSDRSILYLEPFLPLLPPHVIKRHFKDKMCIRSFKCKMQYLEFKYEFNMLDLIYMMEDPKIFNAILTNSEYGFKPSFHLTLFHLLKFSPIIHKKNKVICLLDYVVRKDKINDIHDLLDLLDLDIDDISALHITSIGMCENLVRLIKYLNINFPVPRKYEYILLSSKSKSARKI